MADRAILFVDGNNWYHGCTKIGAPNLFELSYAGISLPSGALASVVESYIRIRADWFDESCYRPRS